MPELPDVEIYKDYFDRTSLHQPIVDTVTRDARILAGISPDELDARLKRHSFERTTRHGKYLFAALDRGGWLAMHFGMTGDLYYSADHDAVNFGVVYFNFTNNHRLVYRSKRLLGRILFTEEPESFIREKKLGPDALQIEHGRFQELLSNSRKKTIKGFLMDQNIIAGIGNVYSDEILFHAGIHPLSRSEAVRQRAGELFRNMRSVLTAAVRNKADPKRMPNFLLLHRHAGTSCPRCGGTIEHMTIAGRSSYFCPSCQKKIE